jgi:hypothetical protein
MFQTELQYAQCTIYNVVPAIRASMLISIHSRRDTVLINNFEHMVSFDSISQEYYANAQDEPNYDDYDNLDVHTINN